MSRDNSTSGIRGSPVCMARTWGAKVKGTSPSRSGRVEAASTDEVPEQVPAVGAAVGKATGYFMSVGGAGALQEGLDGCTMTFVDGCVRFMVCIFLLCSSTVSPMMTKPPSISLSDVDFFESLRSPRKLNMIMLCSCALSRGFKYGHKSVHSSSYFVSFRLMSDSAVPLTVSLA